MSDTAQARPFLRIAATYPVVDGNLPESVVVELNAADIDVDDTDVDVDVDERSAPHPDEVPSPAGEREKGGV